MTESTAPVLLYDGTCGFCADSIRFVLKRDRKMEMHFAALDSTFGRAVLERHPETRGFDSVLYVEPATDGKPEHVYTQSSAVIRIGSYLGGAWHLLQLARILPAFIRDAMYRLIARHRHRLSGSRTQCVIPSAQDRARFLE